MENNNDFMRSDGARMPEAPVTPEAPATPEAPVTPEAPATPEPEAQTQAPAAQQGAPTPPHAPRFNPNGAPMPPHAPQFNPNGAQMPYPPFAPLMGGYPPYFGAPQQKKKKKIIWPFILVGVFVLLIAALLVIGAVGLASGTTSSGSGYAAALPSDATDYVAVFYIDSEIAGDYVTTTLYGSGSTYNQAYFLDTIDTLATDQYNVGIMLYINSPGGEVTATDEFARAITEYKQTTGRPVYAYFADTAASGAYWIGCHADKIIASKFCTTGSIGVTYGTHIEISVLLERLGITVTELTAGDNKAMGSMYSPLTDEQKAMYESQLKEMHELFIDVVATNRRLDKENVRRIADGRTFLASTALEYGLIDGIGYWEDAKYTMTVDLSLSPNVTFYNFVPAVSYSNDLLFYLNGGEQPEKKAEDADDIAALVEELNRTRRFMALYR